MYLLSMEDLLGNSLISNKRANVLDMNGIVEISYE